MATLVEIRPIDTTKWHKKKGKDAFAQPKTVEVLYDSSTGRYGTGLTPELAEKYSKLTGNDLSDTFNPIEPHPFWSSKASWVVLPNQTLILDSERPNEFVKIQNLKASKYVANSQKEYDNGMWPEATHVIYDESEAVEMKANKFELAQQAMSALNTVSLEGRIDLVRILSEKPVKTMSPNFISAELSEIIENKPLELVRTIQMGKEEVAIRATVLELLQKNILTKEAGAVYYMGEKIALDYEDAVKYFKDPNNQMMKVRLLEKLQK